VPASANVASIAAIRAFRTALQQFGEDAADALVTLDLEITRGNDHIQNDRRTFWPAQVRQAWDEIAEARVALQRRRAITVADHRPACDEEKRAVAQAQQRLRTAQEKVEIVRKWCRTLTQEVEEYQGRIGRLRQFLDRDLPRAVAALEQMLRALEAYTAIAVPADETPQKPSAARSVGPTDQAPAEPAGAKPNGSRDTTAADENAKTDTAAADAPPGADEERRTQEK
jgi:hypothetical protein